MSKKELNLIQITLQDFIYQNSDQAIETTLKKNHLNWELIVYLLSYHEIMPFFYIATKPYSHLLPNKVKKTLLWSYYYTTLKNQLLFKKYLYIYNIFQEKEIKVLPIKGIALLYDLYSNFPARPMADIDILIQEENYKKTKEILKQIGFNVELRNLSEFYWKAKQCHVSFRENAKIKTSTPAIEAHLRLDFKRYGRNVLDHIWERTRTLKIKNQNKKINLLSPEDTLFSLALHQRRFGKPLCLKYVLDTILLLKKYREKFDWNYVINESKTENLCSCIYFLLLQCKDFLNYEDITKNIQQIPIKKNKINIMKKFIRNNLDSYELLNNIKKNYLKSHFLIYDNYIEPLLYILFIPIEQFSKFYDLRLPSIKTKILYKFRLLYIFYRTILKYHY